MRIILSSCKYLNSCTRSLIVRTIKKNDLLGGKDEQAATLLVKEPRKGIWAASEGLHVEKAELCLESSHQPTLSCLATYYPGFLPGDSSAQSVTHAY